MIHLILESYLDFQNVENDLDVNVRYDMSSFIILSNNLICHRGERRPRFRSSDDGTILEAKMTKLHIGNLNLVNVNTDKLPEEMKLNSLKIKSSYIKNNFFNKVDVKKMSVENSIIDSISDLGLFGSDIESLREKSNYNNLK